MVQMNVCEQEVVNFSRRQATFRNSSVQVVGNRNRATIYDPNFFVAD